MRRLSLMRSWNFRGRFHGQHPRRRQYFLRPEKILPATLRAWRARDSRAGRPYHPALGKRSHQQWKVWEALPLISLKTREARLQLPLRAETCERAIQNSFRLEVGRLQHCPASWPHVEKGFAIPPEAELLLDFR